MKNFLKAVLFHFWLMIRGKRQMQAPTNSHNYYSGGGRRVKRFPVDPLSIMLTFTQGNLLGIKEGIPPGSRLVGFDRDRNSVYYWLYVEHPFFSRAEPGKEVPEGPAITITDMRETYKELLQERDIR